jgi:hypothetical protein
VELQYGTSKFKAELHKVSGKVKKLKSREDVEKILSTLYDTLDIIKEGKTKKDTLALTVQSPLEFKLVDSVKKDSKRSP